MEAETSIELDKLSQIVASTHLELEESDLIQSELPPKQYHVCVSTGVRYDFGNIIILMFLYLLQGIPLGLCVSIPMLLQSRNVSYKDQALFSIVFWPFSLKLLWAPLVDSLYIKSFGRRKTWLIPVQYLIGIFMILLAAKADKLLGKESSSREIPIDIVSLTVLFFILVFLTATQDIVVDGWALSMLSRRNVGWASICNMVGQTGGFFLGNVLFLALESADFCNKYLRRSELDIGIVTMSSFMYFWGVIIIITTTVLCILKGEKKEIDISHEQGLVDTYRHLLQIIKLPAVQKYTFYIFTGCIGFAAADFITNLKLIENGVKKEILALYAIPMIPVQILIPLYLSKFTTSSQPMNIAIKAIPYRLFVGILYAYCVCLSGQAQESTGGYSTYFYIFLFGGYAAHQITTHCMRASSMAFHAKVSDPAIGGTYMTFLNTVGNLAIKIPGTLSLWTVDSFTYKRCSSGSDSNCYTKAGTQSCKAEGGSCMTTIDGYYVESFICLVIGFIWYITAHRKLKELDSLAQSEWKCTDQRT